MLMEARQSREMGRDLAVLTGGVSLVDTNDPLGGIDRAMRDASTHYVLSYEPVTPIKGSEYRRIDVKVKRPGVRVLARRGYRAASVRPPPPLKLPGSLSPHLRTLLAGIVPDDGLPMRVEAVPVARFGRGTTMAVILEIDGTRLADRRGRSARDRARAADGERVRQGRQWRPPHVHAAAIRGAVGGARRVGSAQRVGRGPAAGAASAARRRHPHSAAGVAARCISMSSSPRHPTGPTVSWWLRGSSR